MSEFIKNIIDFLGLKDQVGPDGRLQRTHQHETLLTTQVKNPHAVSHFKKETFSAVQYAQDFGTIAKASLKELINGPQNTVPSHRHIALYHKRVRCTLI